VYQNRVLYPHIRNSAKPGKHFAKTEWGHVVQTVSEKLKETIDSFGPESVFVLKYAGNTGLLAAAFPLRLWNVIGAAEGDHSVCSQSGKFGLGLHYGANHGIQPDELDRHKLIVFWGFNAVESAPHIWNLANKARKENGARIWVVDVRESETARQADVWLQTKPGSDAALANGIARYLIENGLIDSDFIRQWTHGFEGYKEAMMKWTPEAVFKKTGIDPNDFQKLAAAYGQHRPSATMIGVGIQKNYGGADIVRAASLLPALLGQHRGYFYSNKTGRGIDMNYLEGIHARSAPQRIVSLVEIAENISSGEFKFIFVYGMNPALTLPHQTLLREGFCRDDVFIALHDSHWTETADYADVVLPAQTFLEKDDAVIPWAHRFIRKSNQVVDPLGESRHEIDLMVDIAKGIGRKDDAIFENPWGAVERSMENSLSNGSFQDFLDGKTLELKSTPPDRYPTPSGRIELWSSTAGKDGFNPVPEAFSADLEPGEFLLISSAVSTYTHTQFQEVYGVIPSLVWINPNDAQVYGIKEGDDIGLYNAQGETVGTAIVTDRVPKNLLWSPHEFKGLDGNPQNCITPGKSQPMGGGNVFNSTVVKIKKKL
jgi:anaerobic selenocysteine-containing dehydrogenase